jgi:hypothetical protein
MVNECHCVEKCFDEPQNRGETAAPVRIVFFRDGE